MYKEFYYLLHAILLLHISLMAKSLFWEGVSFGFNLCYLLHLIEAICHDPNTYDIYEFWKRKFLTTIRMAPVPLVTHEE